MKDKKEVLTKKFENILLSTKDEKKALDSLTAAFVEECPIDMPASKIIEQALDQFIRDEVSELLSEIIVTVTADCERDDFHTWSYDHLEFIIDLSNQYNLNLPKNFINGLPEQFVTRIKWERVESPPCEDED